MPLAADSRQYTAFRTPKGVFHWNRVPMGIKQAASYFQMQMYQIFHDLVGRGVELYLDDIILYANTFDAFQKILRTVLTRLREYNIVASPTKTELAFPQLEILGHTVDTAGVKFNKDVSYLDAILMPKQEKEAFDRYYYCKKTGKINSTSFNSHSASASCLLNKHPQVFSHGAKK